LPILRTGLLATVLAVAAATASAAQAPATFPAQQRPPGDPAVIERGRGLYDVHCRACHGADLRGGDLGGPNLLRSPLVLNDQNGESIAPVIRNGRASESGGRPMPPLPLPETDLNAVAEYLHSVTRSAQPQGAPPAGAKLELNLLVGNARKGRQYFEATCKGCHAVDGDLAGIGARLTDIETLQNSWVAARHFGPPIPGQAQRRAQVQVTLKNGQSASGTLERMDDFSVSLRTTEGEYRSYSRRGSGAEVIAAKVDDPLSGHRQFWKTLTNEQMHDVTAYLATLK
jgi:cytochrome c oxidase cbb3-type subunit III